MHYVEWIPFFQTEGATVCQCLVSFGVALPAGGFKHEFYFPFHIWDVILPIHELHHFSRWLLHHQPV